MFLLLLNYFLNWFVYLLILNILYNNIKQFHNIINNLKKDFYNNISKNIDNIDENKKITLNYNYYPIHFLQDLFKNLLNNPQKNYDYL